MRRKWNRFVAGLLSIVLLVTMLPMEVLAAGNAGRGGAAQPDNAISGCKVLGLVCQSCGVRLFPRHIQRHLNCHL